MLVLNWFSRALCGLCWISLCEYYMISCPNSFFWDLKEWKTKFWPSFAWREKFCCFFVPGINPPPTLLRVVEAECRISGKRHFFLLKNAAKPPSLSFLFFSSFSLFLCVSLSPLSLFSSLPIYPLSLNSSFLFLSLFLFLPPLFQRFLN